MVDYQQRLNWAMARAKVSTQALADHLGVSYQAIRKLENGGSKSMTAANNEKAAAFLGVSSLWLATGGGDRCPPQQPALAQDQRSGWADGPQGTPAPPRWPFKSINELEWARLPAAQRESFELQIRAVIDAMTPSTKSIKQAAA